MFYNQDIKNEYLKFYCSDKENTYLKNNPGLEKESALKIFRAKLEIPSSERQPLINGERNLQLFFSKYAPYERKKKKDLFDFTDEEFLDVIRQENINTYSRMDILCSYLTTYREWAVSKGLRPKSKSYHISIDKILNNIDKETALETYMSEEQFEDNLRKLPNAREKFILCCLYEGVKGKMYTDIAQLKMSDIHLPKSNFEKAITDIDRPYIADLSSGNKVSVSNRLYNLARKANYELLYTTMTGDMMTTELADSKYIVKPRKNQMSDEISVRGRNIQMATLRALDYLDLQDTMKPLNITSSGMINSLLKKSRQHKMTLEDYLKYSPQYKNEIDLILRNYGKKKKMTSYLRIYRQYKYIIDYVDSYVYAQ